MIQSRHLFTLSADVPKIVDMGATPAGHRRIATVTGGTFKGERLSGTLQPAEAVDPASYYLRTTPVFETASPKYDWLNRIVSVATGRREKSGPVYEVYEVL